MKRKFFPVLLLCLVLFSFTYGQTTPTTANVPTSSHPAIPSGLKTACLQGPTVLTPCTAYPVLKYKGYTYWAYSYVDNRLAMDIVAYDASGNIAKQWAKSGARYVWKITVDDSAKTVSFWGQASKKIVMSWNELDVTAYPVVTSVPPGSHPTVPSGLKASCLKDPKLLDPCTAYPVLKYKGYTYWAYSYIDNRLAMDIVAYDASGNIAKQWAKSGARYLWKITVDDSAKTVSFWGQASQKIVMSWNELDVTAYPIVTSVPPGSHPTVPSGSKASCLKDPNLLDPCTAYPVLKYKGYTYWAYSYIDNRLAMNIVAYDGSGKVIKQWAKSGARYLWKITVDDSAKTVSFWGQASKKIVMSWNELNLP